MPNFASYANKYFFIGTKGELEAKLNMLNILWKVKYENSMNLSSIYMYKQSGTISSDVQQLDTVFRIKSFPGRSKCRDRGDPPGELCNSYSSPDDGTDPQRVGLDGGVSVCSVNIDKLVCGAAGEVPDWEVGHVKLPK